MEEDENVCMAFWKKRLRRRQNVILPTRHGNLQKLTRRICRELLEKSQRTVGIVKFACGWRKENELPSQSGAADETDAGTLGMATRQSMASSTWSAQVQRDVHGKGLR